MVSRSIFRLGLAAAALVMLGMCEIVILYLYVGAMGRVKDLSVELEFARGAAVIASARAQRCIQPTGEK